MPLASEDAWEIERDMANRNGMIGICASRRGNRNLKSNNVAHRALALGPHY